MGNGRPTNDVVVLAFVGTVCLGVLVVTVALGVVAVVQPERDISRAFGTLASAYSALLGVLAGYLTGRAHAGGNGRRGNGDGG